MQETLRLDFPDGKQLAAALRALPQYVRGDVLATALLEGAEPIRSAAAALASIYHGPRRRPETVPLAETIKSVVEALTPETATVNVQTKKPTAHLREFGHRMVVGGRRGARRVLQRGPHKGDVVGGGHVVGHVPAYPFMRPAADENVETTVQIVGHALGREIEDAFRQLAPHASA